MVAVVHRRSIGRGRPSGAAVRAGPTSLDLRLQAHSPLPRLTSPSHLPTDLTPAAPRANSTPSPHAPASAARGRRSFAISVGAALALNLLGIGAFAAAVARWQAPAGVPQRASWITAVDVARPAVTPEPAAPTRTPPASPPDATPPAAPEPAAPQPAPPLTTVVPLAPPMAADAGDPVRFYRSGEVERPAEPDSDWNLDTAALDTAGIETLVFDIFVNRDGAVVGCMIIAPATMPDAARAALEERLRQTVLRPAIRAGTTVASMRRIEVSVLPPLQ